jgi:hypothetical protein
MGSPLPVFEQVTAAAILATTTSNPGSAWVKVGSGGGGPYICRQISVLNTTGVELQFGIGDPSGTAPSGQTLEVPANAGFPFEGVTTSDALFARRTDQSNTPVTFKSWGRR